MAWGTKLLRDKQILVALILLSPTLIFALAADLIARYPPLKTGVGPSLSPPSLIYPMGTDQLGSDIFSQVVYGSRTAMLVGVSVGLISLLIALIVGLFAGYYGGLLDLVLMRIVDLFLSIPTFILIILFLTIYGNSIANLILILGILSWPIMARIVRSHTLSLREKEFVLAARAIGDRDLSIMFLEILPNIWSSLIPSFLLEVSLAILIESGINFIGMGDPNMASWGKTLSMASRALYTGAWWGALFPGLMLSLTILALNMIGDYITKTLTKQD
jgi:peptide/nickel transport system permease protein